MLDVLGLNDDEELVYRSLVQLPSADSRELARRLKLRKADAARLLTALERNGLAARSSESAERYVASPPSVALAALLASRQDDLRHAETEIAGLAETYRRRESDRTVGQAIDVVHGAKAVGQRFLQLQAAAREEVLGFIKSEVAVVSGGENTSEERAVERGVAYRVVVEQSSLKQPGFLDAAEEAIAAGEQVYVAPSVPIRMIIVDRRIALVPLMSHTESAIGALLIHNSGLLDALLALFERVWRDSVPLVLAGSGVVTSPSNGLSEIDARVMGLLLAGLTDGAIASQLDLSSRTVQRRVRCLMDAAGVETRLQLGFQAATRGWAQPAV
ncbi:helix-turn-helix domain-containing protein [Nocardioides jensenii]|uniref:helix-turn-helix domain-containing protein n=1 Tax=Nocardioides jensenii TaxID=1843 RepID=UPI0008345760|nr:helix-turn-helix domain-containing protein [Nocardioides jensenii]